MVQRPKQLKHLYNPKTALAAVPVQLNCMCIFLSLQIISLHLELYFFIFLVAEMRFRVEWKDCEIDMTLVILKLIQVCQDEQIFPVLYALTRSRTKLASLETEVFPFTPKQTTNLSPSKENFVFVCDAGKGVFAEKSTHSGSKNVKNE